MKVWLYYRLSRDEDDEMNSLNNQRKILVDYCKSKGYEVVGESYDDNISGMHFNREGIEKIYEAVAEGEIEAIIVKDLSRLGRHRTQTALFIDFLRTKNVKVLSVTENIDTLNENDDLLIGFKQILNDFYAKDISRKIRAGYNQKQKEGIITKAPFGYFKDKNTGEITVVEEHAEIIREVFDLYINSHGLKYIAAYLNKKGIASPGEYQQKMYNQKLGYHTRKTNDKYFWNNTTVKRMLTNELYTGTLVCHKTSTSRINKTFKALPSEEHYRHENYVPAIISKETWDKVQFLLVERPKKNMRAASDFPIHRYTGILKCAECGASFTAKRRRITDVPDKIEYVCSGNHRYGSKYCSRHLLKEEQLDELINDEILRIKQNYSKNWIQLNKQIKEWTKNKPSNTTKTSKLKSKITKLENDVEKILMERIQDKENRSTYDNMVKKRREEISELEQKITDFNNYDKVLTERKEKISSTLKIIDEIVGEGRIEDVHLRMLIDRIDVKEIGDNLDLTISLKADFNSHLDVYDVYGELSKRFSEHNGKTYMMRNFTSVRLNS